MEFCVSFLLSNQFQDGFSLGITFIFPTTALLSSFLKVAPKCI